MEEARQEQRHSPDATLTNEEKAMRRERENLLMARSDVLHRIESSSNEHYCELLRQALKELDAKIVKLSP